MILSNRIVCWGKSLFALTIILLFGLSLQAQNTTDVGAMVTAEYQYSFAKYYDVWAKEDIRIDNYCSEYSRSKTTLGFDYKFKKYRHLDGLKMGTALDYIIKYTDKRGYRNRYRISFHFTYKYDYRNWAFAFRTRYQMMMHDETTGYYNYKMQHVWRNRLSVEYHEKNSLWTFGFAGELVSETKGKDLFLDNILLVGNVDYRLTRYHYISFFIRDYRDIYIKNDQVRTLYFGIGFKTKR